MYNQQTYEVCKKKKTCDNENTNFAKIPSTQCIKSKFDTLTTIKLTL